MKNLSVLLFICITSVAGAQPVAYFSTSSSEISSGTIDLDKLLTIEKLIVKDAENPDKKYIVESFVLIHQGSSNMQRIPIKGGELAEKLNEMSEDKAIPLGPGSKIVITAIKVKEEKSSQTIELENGLVLQVL